MEQVVEKKYPAVESQAGRVRSGCRLWLGPCSWVRVRGRHSAPWGRGVVFAPGWQRGTPSSHLSGTPGLQGSKWAMKDSGHAAPTQGPGV